MNAVGPRKAVVLADECDFVGPEEHDGNVVVPPLFGKLLSSYSIAEDLSLRGESDRVRVPPCMERIAAKNPGIGP